ncbi:MAG: sulfite exporter TauE/SafE family protein [Halanaerobiales bacterium]|nr:sulfite exporter TauE/SafE family protein [Halanaerobiales bacterium]
MENVFVLGIVMFIIATFMAMVGKGGGNFYLLAMISAGVSMTHAATTSQLIMMTTAGVSMLVFNKSKRIDWKLALIIDPATDIMAFVGGYLAGGFDDHILKLIFAGVLIVVSFFMFLPVKERKISLENKFGYWKREFNGYQYVVNLWFAIPIAAITGFFAGAIGISGGSFKVPLMVLACGVPITVAVGTSSAMVAVTALMGFIGHSFHGNINLVLSIPLALIAVVGGIVGSRTAININSKNLKLVFALINTAAAIFMIFNIIR